MYSRFMLFCLFYFNIKYSFSSGSTLKHVIVTFRSTAHQACNYPGGPSNPIMKTSPQEINVKLIDTGKRDAYDMGEFVSKQYPASNLSLDKWDNKGDAANFYSFGTGSERTRESAVLFASGLRGDSYPSYIDSTEVAQAIYNETGDFLKFYNPNECPAFFKLVQQEQSGLWKTLLDKYRSTQTDLKSAIGDDALDPQKLWLSYETVSMMKLNNISLPSWANETNMKNLKALSGEFLYLIGVNEQRRRLAGGRLADDIMKDLEKVVNGNGSTNPNIKLSAFGAPQGILAAQISAFMPLSTRINGLPFNGDTFYPDQGAMHVIELHKDNSKWKVQVKYRNNKNGPLQPVVLQACTGQAMCDFSKFKKAIQPVRQTKEQQLTECLESKRKKRGRS